MTELIFRTLLGLAVAGLLGCSARVAPVTAPSGATALDPEPGKEVRWVRDSAEYAAALVQTYRWAGRQLEESAGALEPGRWAVILDADETLISNLGYSLGRVDHGGAWSEDSWREWVARMEATALPGAIEFVDAVHDLGGRVAVVTNRAQDDCEATRENLRAVGVRFDIVLCKDGEGEKDSRWEAIRAGEGTGLGPLEIVMWLGDNILDFPGMEQSSKALGIAAYQEFGVRFFVLPNPLYGSWE